MEYILLFLDGILTFVSPCLLPMLPIYAVYFAGGGEAGERSTPKVLVNALGFILGFSTVFVALGAFAAAVGGLLVRYQTALNIGTGAVVILFGLHYLGLLPFTASWIRQGPGGTVRITGFLSAVLFGLVFSVSWTPCVSAFLGSALMLAAQKGTAAQGVLLLLCYCAGLGIPFLISALLIDRLKGALQFIKRHYNVVNKLSGGLLVATGILMATGLLGRFLSLLA